MQQWQFNPDEGDKAVSVIGTEDVVFYIDDLNPEVVAKIVEIYNQDNDVNKIDAYLKDEERCTEDEHEFIIEQINGYIGLLQGDTDTKSPEEEIKQQPDPVTSTATVTPETPKQDSKEPPFTPTPETGKPADQGSGDTKSEPKKRRQRVTTGTKESTEDIIKSLQEKIDIIKMLDTAQIIEIPVGLTKTSRDFLTEFQKEQEALVAEYMDRAKKM